MGDWNHQQATNQQSMDRQQQLFNLLGNLVKSETGRVDNSTLPVNYSTKTSQNIATTRKQTIGNLLMDLSEMDG